MIGANAVIGPGVQIGRDCSIGPGASIMHALIGDNVIIHAGCRIGQDGFRYQPSAEGHVKVPQLGRVIIQDNVEIGANTTIDRGGSGDTVIGEGTKIDNLVQIGHNCTIGRHCIICRRMRLLRQRRRSATTWCWAARSASPTTSPSARARWSPPKAA